MGLAIDVMDIHQWGKGYRIGGSLKILDQYGGSRPQADLKFSFV
jgi:hypothetical protein